MKYYKDCQHDLIPIIFTKTDKQIITDEIFSREKLTKACDEKHNDEISKLQHQSNQLEKERDRILKEYQTVCKESKELKAG